MCLSFPVKLNQTNDITCYKVCVVNSNNNNNFVSPFQDEKYQLGVLKSINKSNIKFNDCINKNAFHTFKNKISAIQYINFMSDILPNMVIIECIIPKNSNYTYKGSFINYYNTYESYASEKLLPINVVYQVSQEIESITSLTLSKYDILLY